MRDLVLSSGHHVVVGFILRKVEGGSVEPEYEGLFVVGPAYKNLLDQRARTINLLYFV